MKTMEKNHEAKSGYLFVIIEFLGLTVTVLGFVGGLTIPAIVLLLVVVFLSRGFTIVNPNQSTVLILFGNIEGPLKRMVFGGSIRFLFRKISLRARNLDSEPIKVNDKIGNPVMIGVVMVWRVQDTFKAAFDVNDYEHFVNIQTEAAMRKLAGLYPYDNFEDEDAEITLRSGGEEVNEELEREVTERLAIAGIEVMEARINYLAYAQEIAQAMLKRQQATAIVAARFKIVEGAVGMVEMALEELSTKEIVELDEEKKATMVSNLMVVLCGDKEATPIVNTGSIY